MAEPTRRVRIQGFSLVELMVALFFTGLLMAGLGKVYQASLTSFHTSSERITAGRRGRIGFARQAKGHSGRLERGTCHAKGWRSSGHKQRTCVVTPHNIRHARDAAFILEK